LAQRQISAGLEWHLQQNRFTGDIGDFTKFGLLRALSKEQRLGVVWYLYPDENHNQNGRHIAYLDDPKHWRHLDPVLFDGIQEIVRSGFRDVRTIENSGLLGDATFFRKPLSFEGNTESRTKQRAAWFREALSGLGDSRVIFADPDNGLCEDRIYQMESKPHWKRMPLSEAHVLTAGRTGIFYHHNSRWPGGHIKEIQHWMSLLGPDTIGLYWRRYSNRTFFIVHPRADIKYRVNEFAQLWAPHFELVSLDRESPPIQLSPKQSATKDRNLSTTPKVCPECGHAFKGTGWGGMDAHWKAKHENIMPYEEAWPHIKAGKSPSAEITR